MNRFLAILALALLAVFGAPPRAVAKALSAQNIASGVFAVNNDTHAPFNSPQPPDFEPETDACGYETASGRSKWLNRDPIGEEGGTNLYAFVNNEPISWIDILGQSPYSGVPPVYNPGNWNDASTGGRYQYANNCYSYACDRRQDGNKTGPNKPQPGDESGFPPFSDPKQIDCPEIIKRAKGDGLKEPDSKGCCPKGYHKVQLVVDPGVDYHWYRQDQGGGWSHKPGWGPVQQDDASGNPVTDPATADRDYSGTGGPNYSKDCGVLCAPDF